MGVVRDAFARWDATPRPLSESVAAMGPGLAAVAAAVAEHHTRLIVDEYELGEDGQYHVRKVASDLLRCSHTLVYSITTMCPRGNSGRRLSNDYHCFEMLLLADSIC